MQAYQPAYPATLSVDYPDRNLNRWTTFFRLILAIPILIIIGLLAGSDGRQPSDGGASFQYASAGLLFLPALLMILFRQKYPRWWFDWNVALSRFCYRVSFLSHAAA